MRGIHKLRIFARDFLSDLFTKLQKKKEKKKNKKQICVYIGFGKGIGQLLFAQQERIQKNQEQPYAQISTPVKFLLVDTVGFFWS